MAIQIISTEEELKAVIVDCIKKEFQNFLPPLPPQPEELLTSKQSAKLYGVSLPTLFKWKTEGRVKSYRIGTRVRFKRSELLSALQTTIKKKGGRNGL